jgi:hypothetical protein
MVLCPRFVSKKNHFGIKIYVCMVRFELGCVSQGPVEGTGRTKNLSKGRSTRKILPFKIYDYIKLLTYRNL